MAMLAAEVGEASNPIRVGGLGVDAVAIEVTMVQCEHRLLGRTIGTDGIDLGRIFCNEVITNG